MPSSLLKVLTLALVTSYLPSARASLYRAPEDLFTLRIPTEFSSLHTIAPSGNVIDHRGYEAFIGERRIFLGIELTRPHHRPVLSTETKQWRRTRKKLPNIKSLTQHETKYAGVPTSRFSYAFSYEDDPHHTIHREDALFVLRGYRIIVSTETSTNVSSQPTGAIEQIMASFASPLGPPDAPSSSLSQRVALRTRESVNPRHSRFPHQANPPIVIDGNPPLTERTIAVWRQLLEWAAETDCTHAQENLLRKALIGEYRTGGERRDHVIQVESSIDPASLFRLPSDQATPVRKQLTEEFRNLADRLSSHNPSLGIFSSLFDDASLVEVRAPVPLTRQIHNAALESLGFLSAFITEGPHTAPGTQPPPLVRIRFSLELRRHWLTMNDEERRRYAEFPRTWNRVRMTWYAADRPQREQMTRSFMARVRAMARRPGGVPNDDMSLLAQRFGAILSEHPLALEDLLSSYFLKEHGP